MARAPVGKRGAEPLPLGAVEIADVGGEGSDPCLLAMTEDVLQRLAAVIRSRRAESAANSYTKQLLDAGPERCARKLGEEATETVIAAVGTDARALTREAADLLYHLLVVLECRQVPWQEVLAELESRAGTSGLAEKASRPGQVP